MTHYDSARLNDLGIPLSYALGDIFIEFVGNAPADIVGFKTANRLWHGVLLTKTPYKQVTLGSAQYKFS